MISAHCWLLLKFSEQRDKPLGHRCYIVLRSQTLANRPLRLAQACVGLRMQ
jgi:hypothetical protein